MKDGNYGAENVIDSVQCNDILSFIHDRYISLIVRGFYNFKTLCLQISYGINTPKL